MRQMLKVKNRMEDENEKVILESNAVNPFNNWSDWYGADGEAVVTFSTMKNELFSEWERQCVRIEDDERVVETEHFDGLRTKAPGVHRDGTYYDEEDSLDESYSIVVPYGFLSPKLCKHWIQKLNEKFGRNFELEITEEQEQASAGLEDIGSNRIKIDSEDVCDKNAKGENTK